MKAISRLILFLMTTTLLLPPKLARADFDLPLPTGKLLLPKTQSSADLWNWQNTCRSKSRPCAQGTWSVSGTEHGMAYVMASEVQEKNVSFQEVCKGIKASVQKNSKGTEFCTSASTDSRTYLWKVGRTIVSASFSPLESGSASSAAFYASVERLVQKVEHHEGK